jgi:lysophosphatidylcholine acyltransferase/lyso-PAF acetyltransferase
MSINLEPFLHNRSYGVFDYFIYVLAFPVVCVRVFLISFITGVLYLLIKIDTCKKHRYLVQYYSRILLFIFGFYNVKIKNKQFIKTAIPHQAVIVYNHVSVFDSFFIFGYIKVVAPVIYYKMYANIKFLADYVDGIPVNTEKTGTLNSERIKDYLSLNKLSISIAPEGSLSNGNYILQFKTGGFSLNRPVLPVVLKFKDTEIAWVINKSILFILYYSLSRLYNNAELVILDLQTIKPGETPRQFADRVRTLMSNESGIPLINIDGYTKPSCC